MYLNIDDSKLIDSPDSDVVIAAVKQLVEDEYVILTRDDDHYVQTRLNDDGSWSLEFRDGAAERHFAADDSKTTIDDVCSAFKAFYNGDVLSSLLKWERIESVATEPGEGDVEYNGIVMDAEWPAEIEAAQEIKMVSVGDSLFKRTPFGQEKDMPTDRMGNCGDCGVLKGQLHVPDCDIEQCPRCHGQLISCDCEVQVG